MFSGCDRISEGEGYRYARILLPAQIRTLRKTLDAFNRGIYRRCAGIIRQQAGVEAEASFHPGLADRQHDPGAACPFSGQSGAAWYQSVVHVLECAVGLMIGTELVWNKSKKSGRSIIITTLTQSLGMDSHIRRIARSGQDDAEQAVDHIQKTDKKREQYYRFYSGQQFGDAKTYDLCLNSGVIGIDRCVRILTDIYDAKSSEG